MFFWLENDPRFQMGCGITPTIKGEPIRCQGRVFEFVCYGSEGLEPRLVCIDETGQRHSLVPRDCRTGLSAQD